MKLEDLKKIREKAAKDIELRQKNARIKIVVGMGTSGIAAGAREVLKALLDEIAARNLTDVMVTQTGEKGLASHEPMIEVHEEGKDVVIYGNIDAEKARRIVAEHIVNHNPVTEYVIEVK
ncbi:MAG TPA: (2Fe-2S) ferredoxin domain-containing protein [Syntrophorhabdaceae bacterium]|nr:(2Fe-2S) ferredoxin domain-containing protein [Syntrophorhabdaceae bacterium]HPU29254.1 (2Fe-2S) ferredoxin domain-containing protein [Syntrophorhabdaceae bacterium]